MIKERYFYYKDGKRIIRKRGFLYTGLNPFKPLNVDIFITKIKNQNIAYLDIGNILVLRTTKNRNALIDMLENCLSYISEKSPTYELVKGLKHDDLKHTKKFMKELERYHNFKAEYMRQTMEDLKKGGGIDV